MVCWDQSKLSCRYDPFFSHNYPVLPTPDFIAVPLESSLGVYTKTSDGQYSIDGLSEGLVITPGLAPSTISDIAVTKSGSDVVGESRNLVYEFTPNPLIKSDNSKARFYFPQDAFYLPVNGGLLSACSSARRKHVLLKLIPIRLRFNM